MLSPVFLFLKVILGSLKRSVNHLVSNSLFAADLPNCWTQIAVFGQIRWQNDAKYGDKPY